MNGLSGSWFGWVSYFPGPISTMIHESVIVLVMITIL